MFTWAQVLSAFLDGVSEPRDLPAPHSVQHILGEGPSTKTPPKSSHVLSPDTVLTTCNNSLQPHSGPVNQALMLLHFTELKHKACRYVYGWFCVVTERTQEGEGQDVASGPSVSCEVLRET